MPAMYRGKRYCTAVSGCRGRRAIVATMLSLGALILPAVAMADGIGGYFDVGYSTLNSRSTDLLGNESRTQSDAVIQRYSLMFSRSLAPYLKFYASGLFDKTDSTTTSNGVHSDSTVTGVEPIVDLTLRSPVYIAGIRYTKQEVETKGSGSPLSSTTVNESYLSFLGLHPVAQDLPSVDTRFERQHVFTKELKSLDAVRDFAGLTMNYTPTNTFLLQYRPSYTDTTDKLTGVETTDLVQNGRVEYSASFLRNRVAFNTSYNISTSALSTSASGTGTVDIAVIRFAGLSSIDDTPGDGALAQNGALIDGNVTASAGINIGLPPVGGDTRERNIGLDFSIAQDVNTLYLWVDKSLPAPISGSFSWDIYTSTDNQIWSLYTTVGSASFGVFDNRFEISFTPVHTRYIKVVVKPLQPTVAGASSYPDIFVTELQAYSSQPAPAVNKTTRTKTESYGFDGRALLLERANLYYQTSYFLAKTVSTTEQQRWSWLNQLAASHRFSKVFSGSTSAGREDFSEPTEVGYAYVANASLDAVPLKTLHHNLAYSGRFEQKTGGRTNTNSLYLYNNAQLYSGVDLTLAGGKIVQDKDTGQHTESTDLNAALNLQPHPTLHLTFYGDQTRSHNSGGGTPDTSGTTRNTNATATYHPVDTLYLVAGAGTVSTEDRIRRTKNYAVNWSPFPGGDLQFSVAYNESLSSDANTKTQSLVPSVTWKMTRKVYMTAAYQANKGSSDDGTSESKIFSVDVKGFF
jgi:hypothetical protein